MKYKKLGDICDIKSGGTPSRRKKEYWDSGTIPWVKIGDIKGKYISNTSEFITEQGLNESSAKLFKKGTLLYTIFATLGEVAILDIDATTNQAIVGISHTNEVDTNYLYYFLKSKKEYVNDIGRGVAQNNINLSMLKDIDVYLPSNLEQQKISKVLDKAQELINKRKKQIDALDELVKSQFIEMFGDIKNNPIGWEKIKIGDVFEIKTGATPSRKENKYWDNGTIPWIKTTELKEIVINNSEEYITEEGFNKSSVNLLPKNTLLIAMYGQGKTRGMTGKLGIEATTNQACAAILPNPKENMDFIWYQLKLSYEDLRDLGRGGSQPNLNTNLIKSYQLIFPPMELQNKFVQFTKQVDKLKFEMEKSLKELEDNFNSLMQKAFKGELFN